MDWRNTARRFLTLALALTMAGGMTLTARAVEAYDLWVGGMEVTANALSGEGWRYDPGTRTLTLTDYTYTGPGQWFDVGDGREAAAILYRGETPLTVELAGNSSVTHTDEACVASYGVFSEADLTILGDGGLTAASGEAEDCSYGITSNHKIAVLSGKVAAASGKARDSSCGIFGMGGFAVENGTVTATGGEGAMSRGIAAGTGEPADYAAFTVTGGTITAAGGLGSSESEGIFCYRCDLTVSGGTVTATGGPSPYTSYGIYDYGVFSVTGGTVEAAGSTVTATAEAVNGASMGVFDHEGGIVVSGGTLKAVAGTAIPAENGDRALSNGIQSDSSITVSGGQVTAKGGGGLYSAGLFAETDLTVSGGTLTFRGGAGTESSTGLQAGNGIRFEGGTTEALAGETGGANYGVYTDGGVLIRGADTAVTAGSGAAGAFSAGLLCVDGLTMEGGTLKAESGSAPVCYGLAGETVAVRNGTVTGTGGDATDGEETYSIGLYSRQGMTLSGGTVTATGGGAEGSAGLLNEQGELAVTGGTVTAFGESAAALSETMTVEKTGLISFLTGDDGASAKPSDLGAYLETYLDSPAKYISISYGTASSGDVSERFNDVSKTAWYHDAVQWAADKGLMNGVSEDRFAPNDNTTRAMVVTMVWRMEGEPEGGTNPFSDVPADAWYAPAVCWAAENSVVNGTSKTTFSPNTPVTREQLAAILYRYAQAQGKGFTGAWAFPLDFSDAADVSDYADEAMHWMVMQGVITGMPDGTLAPKGNATRAQIAAMFQRFAAEPMSYEDFKALTPEEQKQAFAAMTGPEIYELVKNSDESWPVTAYDLITPDNAKETIVLYDNNGDLHFNLAWPPYGGFLPESIASMGDLSGKVDVSRYGGDGGYSMSYGKNEDGSYPNDSQRAVPKTSATVRTGVLDVDQYKKVVEIVTNGKSDDSRLASLNALGYDRETAARFLSDQAAWLDRDEIAGPDNISDGVKLAGHTVEAKYGYYGVTAPWQAGDLDLAGGGGQLDPVFSWGTLCASGLISDTGTAEIH